MIHTRILALAAVILGSAGAHAHFIWLELDPEAPGEVRLRFAEEILEKTPHDMQELAEPMKVTTPGGDLIEMVHGEEFMSGPVSEDAPFIIGTIDYGILDRSEFGRGVFMLKYHARAARNTAAAGKSSDLPVDVTAKVEGETMRVTVTKDGKPAEGAEVFAILPHTLNPEVAMTNAEGQVNFKIESGDWVALRAKVEEKVTGEHNGDAYENLHNYSMLSFFHAGE